MDTVGDYELVDVLARGSTCWVHLARNRRTDEMVALKEFQWLATSEPHANERFLRAARIGGPLVHPNIAAIRESFEERGTPYIALEYVARGSLRPVVRALTTAQCGIVLVDVLLALDHAASQGLVHRDVKPENLLVAADGTVKLTDFALAVALGREAVHRRLTPPGMVVGTPGYMAPEQVTRDAVTPATDLYAVGCLACEMLTGTLPLHDPESTVNTLRWRVTKPPPDVISLNDGMDAGIAAWVQSLLATDPAQRPSSASAARTALEEALSARLGTDWRKGVDLPDAPAPVHPAPTTSQVERRGGVRVCQSCGKENPFDADFCSCGEYLRWEPTAFVQAIVPTTSAPEPPPRLVLPQPPPPPATIEDLPASPARPVDPAKALVHTFAPAPEEKATVAPLVARPVRRLPTRTLRRDVPRAPTFGGCARVPAATVSQPGAEPVECAVNGPARVSPGQAFEIEAVLRALGHGLPGRVNGRRSLMAWVRRGSALSIELSILGVEVQYPRRTAVWRGHRLAARFDVRVPSAGVPPGPAVGTLVLRVEGWPVGHVRFRLRLDGGRVSTKLGPLGDVATAHRLGFLSYASEDRASVVEAVRGRGIEFPAGALPTDPRSRWERRVFSRIADCDVFLLFWSDAGRRSWWVRREVERALALQHTAPLDAPPIVPLLLDEAPVWPELAHLQLIKA